MIRVANIIEEGRIGGPQVRITNVACALKFSVATTVIMPVEHSERFRALLDEAGIPYKTFNLSRITKELGVVFRYLFCSWYEILQLVNYFRKENFDIIHVSGGAWQFKGVIAGKLAGAKVVWHLNDTQMPVFINLIFKFLAANFCDGFIAAGERVRAYYLSDQRFSKKPIMEIQAPVDTVLFDPEKIKEDHKMAEHHGLKIVTVGNINPWKGIEYFIEMVSILNKEYDDLFFYVVGPHFESQKYYSEKLSKLARNLKLKNLYFYGPSDHVASVLKSADIYVCSSIAEASPISVWEAMSMKKPIVSTDVGDVVRFIKNGENGFVVPKKDAVALADKVRVLIENENLRKVMGQKSRDIAVKYLDVSICAKKHAAFYNHLK